VEAYLEPQDDGLAMRESGDWVAEKLDYLERYIAIFENSMHGKPWRARNYIDLFAGPGKCFVPEGKGIAPEKQAVYLGSPLLALTTSHPFTGYFFVDLETNNIAALKQRCFASPHFDRTRFHVGDSNTVVREIVDYIKAVDGQHLAGKWSSLNMAFLDPAGIDLHWQTVAALAEPYRMDLIIHYPQYGLNRSMGNACQSKQPTKIDRFFGGTEWRDIYAQTINSPAGCDHGRLMDLYKQKLRSLGYQEVFRDDEIGDEPLMRNAEKNAPLYRLLFASKHPLGNKFWTAVTRRDVHGRQLLFRETSLQY
jgi:three-Cys-motif partner protein